MNGDEQVLTRPMNQSPSLNASIYYPPGISLHFSLIN